MFKDSSNQAEFELLIRATRHELFHFIIVQYQHLALVNTVKNDLKAKYPERPFAEFNIENINPDTFIHSILACKTGFVFIEKFELFFQEDLQALAIGFNQRRDLFSTLPIQLIVFVPFGGNILQHFQQTMPDFYSILNLSISLKSEYVLEENVLNTIVITNSDYENIAEAQQEIERIEKRLKTLEDTPENVALKRQIITQLAKAYSFIGENTKSRNLCEQLFQELESLQNPSFEEEVSIAQTKNNLGLLLLDLEDYTRAKDLLKEALILTEKIFGVNHSNTITSYSNLALALRFSGEYQEAKTLLEKIISLNEKKDEEINANLIVVYSNLAIVFQILKDYQGAKEILEKVVLFNEKTFGVSNLTTVISYSNLALALNELGDFENAKTLLIKAMLANELNFGKEHLYTITIYSHLALVLKNLKEYQNTKELLEKITFSYEKNFGKEHPKTAMSFSNLAVILEKLGDYNKAMTLYEKAYQILLKHLGEQHPNTKIVKANLDSLEQKLT